MIKNLSIAASVRRLFKSRMSAVVMLAVTCTAIVVFVVSNLHTVTVNTGSDSKVIMTMRTDSQTILKQAGIELFPEDEIENVNEGQDHWQINVLRATDGIQMTAKADTAEADGVVTVSYYGMLSQYDLKKEEKIEYKTVESIQKIPFETTSRSTTLIGNGRTMVLQKGIMGEKATVYKQKIVNGQVVETVLVGENMKRKPVTERVLKGGSAMAPVSKYGTGGIALDGKGFPVQYRKLYEGSATAYNGPTNRTASGRPAVEGHVAVDPRIIPYGTKLYITSSDGRYVYGYAIAADTGGFIHSGKTIVDLFIGDEQECITFGRRNVKMFVL